MTTYKNIEDLISIWERSLEDNNYFTDCRLCYNKDDESWSIESNNYDEHNCCEYWGNDAEGCGEIMWTICNEYDFKSEDFNVELFERDADYFLTTI